MANTSLTQKIEDAEQKIRIMYTETAMELTGVDVDQFISKVLRIFHGLVDNSGIKRALNFVETKREAVVRMCQLPDAEFEQEIEKLWSSKGDLCLGSEFSDSQSSTPRGGGAVVARTEAPEATQHGGGGSVVASTEAPEATQQGGGGAVVARTGATQHGGGGAVVAGKGTEATQQGGGGAAHSGHSFEHTGPFTTNAQYQKYQRFLRDGSLPRDDPTVSAYIQEHHPFTSINVAVAKQQFREACLTAKQAFIAKKRMFEDQVDSNKMARLVDNGYKITQRAQNKVEKERKKQVELQAKLTQSQDEARLAEEASASAVGLLGLP